MKYRRFKVKVNGGNAAESFSPMKREYSKPRSNLGNASAIPP
jgi:hypothetical protein